MIFKEARSMEHNFESSRNLKKLGKKKLHIVRHSLKKTTLSYLIRAQNNEPYSPVSACQFL